MARSKDKDGIEYWRGKYRQLVKEVRQLKKQLKYYQKYDYIGQDDSEEIADSEDTHPKELLHIKNCPECARPGFRVFEIVGRVYETCDICGYRKKL